MSSGSALQRSRAQKPDSEDLAGHIYTDVDIDSSTIKLLSKSQNVSKFPTLALTHFHICSGDPNAHHAVGEPVGQDVAARLRDPGSDRIAVCASRNALRFMLNEKQVAWLYLLEEWVIERHVMVLRVSGSH
ncbi:hypothetical protein SPRG_16848 [Saprolegnia parasitica CBS 223.65]|uniref:Uncharacterized protein n=1 Tax=Saprolegnia parasitica (strain CBS 223.65) TaxID=695850 RepID=A0A067BLY4_SAPPC|nr:hypothetical protein SPRG_16848 [Saprolegnia parasitica CBS 223.65]KDO17735.1 hypothetical protein SPRG_16848 [Saprolegnia parasitica CBS 223.65]|eukprot:XP_012211557.1 hypothetical protein SPRG_16848 [Saprolegnia parasitica CBS 223.65]